MCVCSWFMTIQFQMRLDVEGNQQKNNALTNGDAKQRHTYENPICCHTICTPHAMRVPRAATNTDMVEKKRTQLTSEIKWNIMNEMVSDG